MVNGSLALFGSRSRCGGFAGPGHTVWRVQSCIAFLAPLGGSLLDQHGSRVRLMRQGPPRDLLVPIMEVVKVVAADVVRTLVLDALDMVN